ncbi:MAG: 23S rRNA (pseudouridine(1915)-N(3))-methyltransferase RlmH, partial [Bdellovibrionales bacterium]|nr:23S rRNA (pseudouridine(1915)-N(3))-methyltransferase RlmH [Bdellovibrionales bacterium]
QKKISFGPQTFSHELARPVLAEQIYRAMSVLKGHPYHNEG